LYILLDGRRSPGEFAELATSLIGAGAGVLQLRDKQMNDRDLLARGRLLREVTRHTRSLYIVNDRPDVALLSDADGVHVGQDELMVRDVRRLLGTDRLVGVSTHSIDQAEQAVRDGADYIGCGPTFASTTKQFDVFPGPEYLHEVASWIRIPAFAIGGITRDNVHVVTEAGFRRVAVGAAVVGAPVPAEAARVLLAELNS
jgi:thiamine-phosphate pyrophosphorylase